MLSAGERSAIYEIFASTYTKLPTVESLRDFMIFTEEITKIIDSPISKRLAELAAERSAAAASSASALQALQQEYYDHFFVPCSGKYVPPFESAIKYNTLWSEDAVHCAACYETLGFEPRSLEIFPPLKEVAVPDHIGFQLAFMAFLTKGESVAEAESEGWQGLQSQFLREHLLSWLPDYAAALAKTGGEFYAALTALLAEFTSLDAGRMANSRRVRGEVH
ncbi:TorD/DmsD family molecular chaperone [Sporolituus thermophilus]|uniref:Chaperone TorD involved in molybdoenzyme TorA maturation n=1 Tax=Sporolituus thermophilus DSM 23256 TaxID=1123285 RepID=A0A1G7KZL2_9FIRM|nr:molecular chaperone TorD family protein [Sporolituus thermophilus]SDF42189.1 chaperone TorD involved in molybdoenzyme TorA maturation [Sporolituus thermophilus DSM 23256]